MSRSTLQMPDRPPRLLQYRARPRGTTAPHRNRPVVVAVRTVLVVQVTVHDVIDVFAVRNRGVATTRAVTMRARMGSALVPLRACVGVLLAYGDCVLFEVLRSCADSTFVQKVAMAVMLDHRMSSRPYAVPRFS